MKIRNYIGRVEFKQGKFAYKQTDIARKNAHVAIEKLRRRWRPPSYCFHLRRGGHLAAISEHTENNYFAKIDIQNFFPSIGKNKLIRTLKKIGFSFAEADELASISTVSIGGSIFLPYGFIQSPILATIVLVNSALGKAINECRKDGICITVYVDDILISSNEKVVVDNAFEKISAALVAAGFATNPEKTRSTSNEAEIFNILISHHSQYVTEPRMQKFRDRVTLPSGSNQTIVYVKRINEDQAVELEQLAR